MAAGGADVVQNISENLLSCDVCLEPFDTSSRTPRILRCNHTFCERCLKQIKKNDRVRCPMCRQSTTVEGKFPVDVTRMTLLDMLESAKRPKNVACEGCEEGAKAQYRCQECAEYLCRECSDAHRRVRQTKSHVVISFAEAAEDPSKFVQTIENCSRHTDKKLDMYCTDCNESVCIKCTLVKHKDGHEIKEIDDDFIETLKEEMTKLCRKLEKLEPTFQSGLEQAQDSLETVDTNLQEAEQRIKEAADHVVTAVREKERQLLEELRSRAQRDRYSHEKQVAIFRSLMTEVQTATKHGRRLISLNLATQMLQQTECIGKTREYLKERASRDVKTASTYEVVAPTETITEMIEENWTLVLDDSSDESDDSSSSRVGSDEDSSAGISMV